MMINISPPMSPSVVIVRTNTGRIFAIEKWNYSTNATGSANQWKKSFNNVVVKKVCRL